MGFREGWGGGSTGWSQGWGGGGGSGLSGSSGGLGPSWAGRTVTVQRGGGIQPYGSRPQTGAQSAIDSYYAAMRETERRRAEDRARAMAEIRLATQAAEREMTGWKSQVTALGREPETITPAVESQIYEAARVPIEAQTQSLLRGLQERFAGRGLAGGISRGPALQTQLSKIGQLSRTRRETALQRVLKRRQDLMRSIGASGELSRAYSNIYGQQGRSLASLYGQTTQAIPEIPYYGGGGGGGGGTPQWLSAYR